jgi:hypothetical protein
MSQFGYLFEHLKGYHFATIATVSAVVTVISLAASVSVSLAAVFYFLELILTFATLFLPGYAILGRFKYFSSDERVILAFGVSVALVGVTTIILVLLGVGLTGPAFLTVQILMLALSVAWILKESKKRAVSIEVMPLIGTFTLILFAAAFLALPVSIGDLPFTSVQYLVRVPFLGGDSMMYYNYAVFLLHQLDPNKIAFWGPQWYITDRTPLQGIIEAFFLESYGAKVPVSIGNSNGSTMAIDWQLWLGGFANAKVQSLAVDDFTGMWVHRLVGVILNSFILVPAFFVAKSMFGRSAAKVTVALMLVSPWFLEMAMFLRPIPMSIYFVLTAFYLLLRQRSTPLAGAMIGLGYLSHPVAAIYAIGCAIYLFWKKTELGSPRYMGKMSFFIVAGLVVLPWILWSKIDANSVVNLPFFLIPLDVRGYTIFYDVHNQAGYRVIIDTFLHTSPVEILFVRVLNISRTFLNIEFANYNPYTGPISPAWNFAFQHVWSLTGAVPFALAPVAYYATVKYMYRVKEEFVSMLVVPFALLAFMYGYSLLYSLVITGMDAIIVMIIIAGANLLLNHRRILALVYALMLLEYASIVWIFLYNPTLFFVYYNDALQISTAIITATAFALVVCYSFLNAGIVRGNEPKGRNHKGEWRHTSK